MPVNFFKLNVIDGTATRCAEANVIIAVTMIRANRAMEVTLDVGVVMACVVWIFFVLSQKTKVGTVRRQIPRKIRLAQPS